MIHAAYGWTVRYFSRPRLAHGVLAAMLLLSMLYIYEFPQHLQLNRLTGYWPQSAPGSSSDLNPNIDASGQAIGDHIHPHENEHKPPYDPEAEEDTKSVPPPKNHDSPQQTLCDEIRARDDIVIIVKTGATEAFERIPTLFVTTLKCVKHVLVFSDMEQEVGPYHIYDALDEVPDQVKKDNEEFDLYRLQQEYKATGQDIQDLNWNKALSGAAWTLDKYKNIHMAQKTWKMKPDASWYFFIDADTYVVWPSLLRWLERLDPTQPLYLGLADHNHEIVFAHGGSGYILSKATMKGFLENNPDVATKFDERVIEECCGDLSIAKALYESDFRLTRAGPMTQMEKPRTIPFGPSRWCQPVVTMHHVNAEEVSDIWQYEQTRKNQSEPLLYEEIYRAFMEPKIAEEIEWWDNLSRSFLYRSPEDTPPWDMWKNISDMSKAEKDAYKSPKHCAKACKEDQSCYQWRYSDMACSLAPSFKLGEKQRPKAETKFISGWDIEKINQFREKTPCTSPEWVVDSAPLGYKKVGNEYIETPYSNP